MGEARKAGISVLIALTVAALWGRSSLQLERDLVGIWTGDDVVIAFRADGAGCQTSGTSDPEEFRYQVHGHILEISYPDKTGSVPVDVLKCEDDRLYLGGLDRPGSEIAFFRFTGGFETPLEVSLLGCWRLNASEDTIRFAGEGKGVYRKANSPAKCEREGGAFTEMPFTYTVSRDRIEVHRDDGSTNTYEVTELTPLYLELAMEQEGRPPHPPLLFFWSSEDKFR